MSTMKDLMPASLRSENYACPVAPELCKLHRDPVTGKYFITGGVNGSIDVVKRRFALSLDRYQAGDTVFESLYDAAASLIPAGYQVNKLVSNLDHWKGSHTTVDVFEISRPAIVSVIDDVASFVHNEMRYTAKIIKTPKGFYQVSGENFPSVQAIATCLAQAAYAGDSSFFEVEPVTTGEKKKK